MARVNIEERLFGDSRLKRFSAIMGIETTTAIGILALIWKESQELLRCEATKEDIEFWSCIKSKKKRAALIDALSHEGVRFIHKTDADLYEIHGNFEQINTRISNSAKSGKGGEANRRKWEEIKKQRLSINMGELEAMPQAMPQDSPSNAMQCNASQCSASNERKVASALVKTGDEIPFSDPPKGFADSIKNLGKSILPNNWNSDKPTAKERPKYTVINKDGSVIAPIFLSYQELVSHCKADGIVFREQDIKKVGNYYAFSTSDKR